MHIRGDGVKVELLMQSVCVLFFFFYSSLSKYTEFGVGDVINKRGFLCRATQIHILEELSSLTKMLLPVLSLAQAQQTSCNFWTYHGSKAFGDGFGF